MLRRWSLQALYGCAFERAVRPGAEIDVSGSDCRALTAIFAASIGLVQNDIKRVLAYSTVSQLDIFSRAGRGSIRCRRLSRLHARVFPKLCSSSALAP